MTTGNTSSKLRFTKFFQYLVLFTILAIFILIALGGTVRVTESGLGCPDWPLCHGQIIPPFEKTALIEYSHRLVASIISILVLTVFLIGWKFYRNERWIFIPTIASIAILTLQIALGAITVLMELPPLIVLVHLATAQALLACMIFIYLALMLGSSRIQLKKNHIPILSLITLATTFVIIISGSYVTATNASSACGQSWPLCLGQIIPAEYPKAMINSFHRYIVFIVTILISLTMIKTWGYRDQSRYIAFLIPLVVFIFILQIFIGAAIWKLTDISTGLIKVLHLAIATASWGTLFGLFIVTWFNKSTTLTKE